MNLLQIAEQYIEEKSNSKNYNQQIRHRTRSFVDFLGRDVSPESIKVEQINGWLGQVSRSRKMSSRTLKGYRNNLVSVLNYAAMLGLCERPPTWRLKRIKLERLVPKAWSRDEITRLYWSAGQERDYVYWNAWVRVAYDTGARREDVMDFESVSTSPWVHRENKTGNLRRVRVREESKEAFCRLLSEGRTLTWTRDDHTWFRHARRIIKRAELTGTMKWLRRSHETHAGVGSLGHRCPTVSLDHYYDPNQDDSVVPLP